MYYEVYVDVLFVENLWMNTVLLLIIAWADHAPVKKIRVAAAAVTGSLGACMLTIASARLSGTGYFLGSLAVAAGMVLVAFSDRRHWGFRVLLLYLECFVLNGILRYLGQFHRLSGIWFAVVSSIAAAILFGAEYILKIKKRQRTRTCTAVLYHGGLSVTVEALYDTGNGLYDPISGRPVSILDERLLNRLLMEADKESLPRIIPYHTISQQGILTAYILDRMELETSDGMKSVTAPMIAGMPKESRQYPLILHRDLLSS